MADVPGARSVHSTMRRMTPPAASLKASMFAPIESDDARSVRSAEAFVPTIKRDYARVSSLPNARKILQLLPKWFEHYKTVHPHRAFGYRLPREFIAERKTR